MDPKKEVPESMQLLPRRAVVVLVVLLAAGTACSAQTRGADDAGGDAFNRPVNLVVPFGPGGGSDQLARIAAPALEKSLGVEVPVVNTPGGSGSTGVTSMLSDPPGESAVLYSQDVLIPVALGAASYRLDEIQGVCRLQEMPSGIMVRSDGPYRSWEDLASAARENPGKLKVVTTGQGSADDVMLAALAEKGFRFRAVPYAEPGERYAALLGGAVDALYEQPGDVIDDLESGRMRAVLIFSDRPVEGLEGDPALGPEIGVDLALDQFRGIVTSRDASPEKVRALERACSSVRESARFQRFQRQNFSLPDSYMGAGEFDRYLRTKLEQFEGLAERYGLRKVR